LTDEGSLSLAAVGEPLGTPLRVTMTENAAISRQVGLLGNAMNSGYSTSPSPIVAHKASSMCRTT
jgi:hypothetical protein